MIFPDFLTWAQNIIMKARQYGTAEMEIERGLQESFRQGRSLGKREGYEEAMREGWWREQERQNIVDAKSALAYEEYVKLNKKETH